MPAVRRLFLMTNTGTAVYLGITTGLITPRFRERHVVATGAAPTKPIGLEHFDELLIRNGAKL